MALDQKLLNGLAKDLNDLGEKQPHIKLWPQWTDMHRKLGQLLGEIPMPKQVAPQEEMPKAENQVSDESAQEEVKQEKKKWTRGGQGRK